jgi:choline dehydrogenase
LLSTDPKTKPRIDPGYLTASGDLIALRNCLEIVRDIAQQDSMRPWIARERSPGPSIANGPAMDAWIRGNASTCFHPVGTCAMGTDPSVGAVTDANLQVHGIEGLRVADASVIPAITGGNTAAPVMMIAEKAAQAIIGS